MEGVKLVGVRGHVGVVGMSEEVLQPPDRDLQRVMGLVHDEGAQLSDRSLVLRVGHHLTTTLQSLLLVISTTSFIAFSKVASSISNHGMATPIFLLTASFTLTV